MAHQIVYRDGQKVPVKLWNKMVPMEPGVYDQAELIAGLPFIHSHIALMPDAHVGKGATVGSVIATKGAVIPAAVGVDIGCGMIAVQTTLTASNLPDDMKPLYHQICRDIPVGRAQHRSPVAEAKPRLELLQSRLDTILKKNEGLAKTLNNHLGWTQQMGTLGGGNHFIEVCLDTDQKVWFMLHSGSRGIGNSFGTYFIKKAQADMKKYFINLPDQDLAYLVEGTEHFDNYVEAVEWAQEYAMYNRDTMLDMVLQGASRLLPSFTLTEHAINAHHNYISRENHFGENVILTRKGAINAHKGKLGIIPGSMGAKSFIVRGLGNKESFCSCSHGAGRVMSRTAAKKLITLEDHAKATEGVICRKDESVIDESPQAYKDIDAVMGSQDDLVEIVHTLKQIMSVKG